MDRLLNVITVFSLLLIGLVLLSVRRAHIRVEYSVSWLIAAVVLLVLVAMAGDWSTGSPRRWAKGTRRWRC